MKLNHDLIIIDGEFNGKEMIELGAVFMDRHGVIHKSTFQSYIYSPSEPINCDVRGKPKKVPIYELIHTTWDTIENAPTFPKVAEKFIEWTKQFGNNFYLASWGVGDAPALYDHFEEYNIKYPFRRASFDIKSFVVLYTGLLFKKHKNLGLRSLMDAWDCPWQDDYGEQHRALADAYNTAILLENIIIKQQFTVSLLKTIVKRLYGKL